MPSMPDDIYRSIEQSHSGVLILETLWFEALRLDDLLRRTNPYFLILECAAGSAGRVVESILRLNAARELEDRHAGYLREIERDTNALQVDADERLSVQPHDAPVASVPSTWQLFSGDAEIQKSSSRSPYNALAMFNIRTSTAYVRTLNRLTYEFITRFCDDGVIQWERIVKLGSAQA